MKIKGFSTIEVIVSIIIISVGLVSLTQIYFYHNKKNVPLMMLYQSKLITQNILDELLIKSKWSNCLEEQGKGLAICEYVSQEMRPLDNQFNPYQAPYAIKIIIGNIVRVETLEMRPLTVITFLNDRMISSLTTWVAIQ